MENYKIQELKKILLLLSDDIFLEKILQETSNLLISACKKENQSNVYYLGIDINTETVVYDIYITVRDNIYVIFTYFHKDDKYVNEEQCFNIYDKIQIAEYNIQNEIERIEKNDKCIIRKR